MDLSDKRVLNALKMNICNHLRLEAYKKARKIIDDVWTFPLLDNYICQLVFKFLYEHECRGQDILELFDLCDRELGVFVRMIELAGQKLVWIDSQQAKDALSKFTNRSAIGLMRSCAIEAKKPHVSKTTTQLCNELLELL